MCTPVAAMVLTAAGTVSQMQSASAQANYQAQVADNNAKLATAQAVSNAEAGSQEAQRTLQRAKAFKSQQNASMGTNGIDSASGSPLDVLTNTERMGQLDKANVLYNTAQNTWALQNQANDYTNQASAYRTAGKNNRNTALLNGVSKLSSQYSGYEESGAFSKKKVKQ